ncbi:MAG: phage portal protein [Mangrovibacterium sp.]
MPSIQEILQNENFGQVVTNLCVDTIEGRTPREYMEEYNGERKRRKTSVGWREPKRIAVYSETLKDAKGNPLRLEDKIEDVARIVTNFPKKLIRNYVAFMFGGRMNIVADDQNEGFDEFKRVWERKLKMQSVLKEFARKVMSETKGAIVFFPTMSVHWSGAKQIELKAKILSQPVQDNITADFYPHFDDNDDMDGFIHRFQIRVDGITRDRAIIWTREKIITGTQGFGSWEVTQVDNIFGLIPVVYGDLLSPAWDEVARVMDAREMRLSRMADTNDYFGDPILKTFGETDLPSKSTAGKQIGFPIKIDPDSGKDYHGDADYLSWQQSIDSITKELEETRSEQFSGASTADLSFDNMKSIGAQSGVSRKFMMLDCTIKNAENMEIFGPAIQRCVSVVTAGICNITNIKYRPQLADNWITVTFDSILPKDPVEDAQILNLAGGGKAFNSRQTIVTNSPLTPAGDIDGELERMAEEDDAEAARNQMTGTTFGG